MPRSKKKTAAAAPKKVKKGRGRGRKGAAEESESEEEDTKGSEPVWSCVSATLPELSEFASSLRAGCRDRRDDSRSPFQRGRGCVCVC